MLHARVDRGRCCEQKGSGVNFERNRAKEAIYSSISFKSRGERGEKIFFFYGNSTVIRKYIYLIYDIRGPSSYLSSCDPSETREGFHNCKTSSETLKVR